MPAQVTPRISLPELGRVGQARPHHVARRHLDLAHFHRGGGVEAKFVQRLQHPDEFLAQAVLEGDTIGVDPPRDENDLLVLDVDALNSTDVRRELEDLELAEGVGGEPAPFPLPDDGRVQTLLDGGPDRERGRELVALDHEVGTIADTDLVDVGEQAVCSVTGEDVRQAGLDPHAHESELAAPLQVAERAIARHRA